MDETSTLLSSPAAFEEYCAALTEKLSSAREARLEFLTYAIERLSGLKEFAEKLSNAEIGDSVEVHLAEARSEMEGLKSLVAQPW
jgi:hypothetical protein